jgi:hypothetical protein
MSSAINARFRNGVAETRYGSVVMAWLNKITGSSVGPWSAVYGVGEFRDPSTFTEYVLLAADGGVYACVENNSPVSVPLPAGQTISDRVTFLQCFNVVLLLRGFDATPLVMDDFNLGFREIVQTGSGTGTLTIPNCLRGVFAGNRAWLMREDDTVVASDILDYTRYQIEDDFKLNQGDADKTVAIMAFGAGSLIIFKERSVYRLDNVYGDLGDMVFSLVTNRYGCLAAESVVNCGSDVLWLSQEGVASLTLTEQNEVQAAQGALAGKNRMFSEDIGPLLDRVNGRYTQYAHGTIWNDRYYLGLPVDQAETLGPELVNGQETLPTGILTVRDLVIGQTYRWTPGDTGGYTTTLVCGSLNTTTASDFIATATTATITVSFADSWFIQDSLKRLAKGANNILAHYDFQNAAWGGYDMADMVTFKYVFTAAYIGRRRLFAIDAAGYVRLWEEGNADRNPEPYVDIVVSSAPSTGNTVQINGGTTVAASTVVAANFANTWSAQNLASARANLWGLGQDTGYSPDAVTPWTATNTRRKTITNGVRFIGSNGIIPTVVTTGTWATVTYYTESQIQTTLVTRGYRRQGDELSGPGRLNLDVQTWNPSTSLSLLSDGVNEETTLFADRTRSRTTYYRPFNQTAYDQTNVNDDFSVPHRQDYSIAPTSSSFAFTPPEDSDVSGDLHQAARYPARIPGPYRRVLRFQIDNTQGRIRLLNLDLEYTRGRRGLAVTN